MNFFLYTLLLKINFNIFYSSKLETCRNNNNEREKFQSIRVHIKKDI